MKLNLGCGQNKREGFINVDKYPHCQPDLVMDLEVFPWGFEDNQAEEVLLNHVLEHLGKDIEVFFSIMKELYRVCKNGAKISINVPHPRHDFFINDPTHVRIITPGLLKLFSKQNCLYWKKVGNANTPLALYLDVDFEFVSSTTVVGNEYIQKLNSGQLTNEELLTLCQQNNNVAEEYRMVVSPVK